MTNDPMDQDYRYYPPESFEDVEADDLVENEEILCEMCEERKESARGDEDFDPNWGKFINCAACKQEAADAIKREREEREDEDRIRRS